MFWVQCIITFQKLWLAGQAVGLGFVAEKKLIMHSEMEVFIFKIIRSGNFIIEYSKNELMLLVLYFYVFKWKINSISMWVGDSLISNFKLVFLHLYFRVSITCLIVSYFYGKNNSFVLVTAVYLTFLRNLTWCVELMCLHVFLWFISVDGRYNSHHFYVFFYKKCIKLTHGKAISICMF